MSIKDLSSSNDTSRVVLRCDVYWYVRPHGGTMEHVKHGSLVLKLILVIPRLNSLCVTNLRLPNSNRTRSALRCCASAGPFSCVVFHRLQPDSFLYHSFLDLLRNDTHNAIERTRSRVSGDNRQRNAHPETEASGGQVEEESSDIETEEIGKVRIPSVVSFEHLVLIPLSAHNPQLESPLFKIPGELRNQTSHLATNEFPPIH